MQTVEQTVATTRHPLDPLTAGEVQAASSILKKERGLDADHRFVYVMLNEPSKKDVLAYKPGNGVKVDREAFIVLRDRSNGEERPVLYRGSVSEMWIPYGDPSPQHYRKNVFDMGEYGVGLLSNSLELGCDCLGEIRYFDGVVNDNDGNPLTITNAICLHEEDYGILWKHMDFRTGQTEVRRSRRLVLSNIATVGNYEFGYFWYFNQDGSIGYEVKMTGVMSNGSIAEGQKPKHGYMVAPGVYGPHHQHFFSLRLDMMVDGLQN